MDVNVIVALIGLTGISLGAVFSGLGYFFKVSSERKQTKKNVLYHLLEIRHLIHSEYADPDEVLEKYSKYFKDYLIRRGMNENDAVASPDLLEILKEHFHAVVLTTKPRIDDNFTVSYENAINSLSFESPVLAFKLKGRNRIDEFLRVQNNYLSEFEDFRKNDAANFKSAVDKQVKNIHYDGIETLIKDFDEDIKLISRSCGLFTVYSLRRLFKETSKREVQIDTTEMDKTMDNFFNELAENIRQNSDLPAESREQVT